MKELNKQKGRKALGRERKKRKRIKEKRPKVNQDCVKGERKVNSQRKEETKI